MKLHSRMLAIAAALFWPTFALEARAADLTAQIPFSFAVNGAEMPAGRYTFKDRQGPLLVSGPTRTTVVLTIGASATGHARPRVVFAKSGDSYVLAEAWSGAEGRQVPRRKVERELARLARGGRLARVERVEVPAS